MNEGILFRSAKFKSENVNDEKTYQFVVICGRLTDDPKIEYFKNTKVSFNLKYYTHCFMNVVIWGDSDVSFAARALEKSDTVLCAGLQSTRTFVAEKGEHKGEKREWVELNPVWLHAQSWDAFLLALYSTPEIRAMIERADTMESLGDDTEAEPVSAADSYRPSI